MLERCKKRDIRWEQLQNDTEKANHRLYKSLYRYMEKKIQKIDKQEIESDNDEVSASSNGSNKRLELLGKRGKPEIQI